MQTNQTEGPRSSTQHELSKAGVEILDETGVRLRCAACGQVWSPNLLPGGKLPKGDWRCPNGCNSE
jgi:uncharacterized Zn finger protein